MSECVCVCVRWEKTKEELGRLRLARTSRFQECAVQSRDCANYYVYKHKVNVTPLSATQEQDCRHPGCQTASTGYPVPPVH